MPNTLSNDMIRRIRELLSEGRSQREVAWRVGVSRPTVRRIDQGKVTERDETPLRPFPPKDYQRCPQCGAKAQPPCLACELKKYPKDRS